mmetsp:Transcript_23642/g.69644  ORF Transcript_23642/g.69644 Transcript_23642/m.69644 type:complete len:259 (-) Transcript_23642:181-957(-)
MGVEPHRAGHAGDHGAGERGGGRSGEGDGGGGGGDGGRGDAGRGSGRGGRGRGRRAPRPAQSLQPPLPARPRVQWHRPEPRGGRAAGPRGLKISLLPPVYRPRALRAHGGGGRVAPHRGGVALGLRPGPQGEQGEAGLGLAADHHGQTFRRRGTQAGRRSPRPAQARQRAPGPGGRGEARGGRGGGHPPRRHRRGPERVAGGEPRAPGGGGGARGGPRRLGEGHRRAASSEMSTLGRKAPKRLRIEHAGLGDGYRRAP